MDKLYTILYTVDTFNKKQNEDMITTNEVLDMQAEPNKIVSKLLNSAICSPSQKSVNKVLDFLKSEKVF